MRAVQVSGVPAQRFFVRCVMVAMHYPSESRADSGGRHATVDRKPTDLGRRDLKGFTTRFADWIEHPTDPQLQAHPIDLQLVKKLTRLALDESERAQLDALLATDGELGAEWDSEVDDGEDGTMRVHKTAPDVRPDDLGKLRRP